MSTSASQNGETATGSEWRLSEVRLRRALNLNIVCGSMAYIYVALAAGGYLTGFLMDVGATTWQIGLLSSIGLIMVAAQIPSALLLERIGRRKVYWGIITLAHRLLWWGMVVIALMKGGLGGWKPVAVLWLFGLSSLLANASVPVWYSWMTDLVPDRRRADFFGRRLAICTVVYLVHMVLSSVFMDRMPDAGTTGHFGGYAILFAYGAFFGCLDIILHLWIPEPPMQRLTVGLTVRSFLKKFLAQKQYLLFMGVSTLYMFGAQITAPFWIPFFRKEWQMDWSFMIGMMGVVTAVTSIVGSRVWGYVAARYGHKPVLIICMISPMLYWLDWLVISDKPLPIPLPWDATWHLRNFHLVLTFNSLLGGFFWTGFALCLQNINLALAPKEGRSLYLAAGATVQGVAAALGPLLGSRIISWAQARHIAIPLATGTTIGYMHVAMLATLIIWTGCLLFMFWLKEPGEKPVGLVFGRLMMINPIRLILNLYAIQYARSAGRKVQAVRGIGRPHQRLAINEVIRQIEDPDYEVREAAVNALGEMADHEAIEVLAGLLGDGEGDVRAAAARALGRIQDPRSVEVLLGYVMDADPEVRRETVVSLGRLAAPEAAPALLKLLETMPSPPIYAAAAQALSRVGEWNTIPRVIPVYLKTRNRRFRNRLAIALADIAGQPGEFYPLLCKELRLEASGIRVLKYELRRQIIQRVRQSGRNGAVRHGQHPKVLKSRYTRLLEEFLGHYEEENRTAAIAVLLDLARRLPPLLGHEQAGPQDPAVAGTDPRRERLAVALETSERILQPEAEPDTPEIMLALYLMIQSFRVSDPSAR